MKRHIISVIAIFSFLLALVSCSPNPSNIGSDSKDPFQNEGNSTTTHHSTNAPTKATQPNLDDDSCAVAFKFYSVADMDKYVATGSTDPQDYQHVPISPPLTDMLDHDFVWEYGYLPLSYCFEFDETEFEYVEVYFRFESYITCHYLMDNLFISVERVVSNQTTLDLLSKKFNYSAELTPVAYEAGKSIENGMLVRQYKDYDIVYTVEDGTIVYFNILVDNYLIRIVGIASFSDESSQQKYHEFITDPKYASFAALFSEDDELFARALDKLIDGIHARAEEG